MAFGSIGVYKFLVPEDGASNWHVSGCPKEKIRENVSVVWNLLLTVIEKI